MRDTMLVWKVFPAVLVLWSGVVGAPLDRCPKLCTCTTSGAFVEMHCQSFDFLKKIEEVSAIRTLKIVSSSVKTIPDLTHFHNLQRLVLPSNKIQQVIATHLPNSLELLDVSHNAITHLPYDLLIVPELKKLNLDGNPLSCDCDALAIRDALLEKNVVTGKVTCREPETERGKPWKTATCKNSLFGVQGDEPYEGSGFESDSLGFGSVTENEPRGLTNISIEEEEYMPLHTNQQVRIEENKTEEHSQAADFEKLKNHLEDAENLQPEEVQGNNETEEAHGMKSHEEIEIPEEGSGEPEVVATTQESDYDENTEETDYSEVFNDTAATEPPVTMLNMSVFEQSRVKACNFNCSTPAPLFDINDTSVSPAPGFLEGFRIMLQDIVGTPEITTPVVTIPPSTSSSTSPPITTEKIVNKVPVEKARALSPNTTVSPNVELIKENIDLSSTKENTEQLPAQQSKSTYIFLLVLLAVIVCLVMYAIFKKRSNNKRSRNFQVPPPLKQQSETVVEDKLQEDIEMVTKSYSEKANGTAREGLPLMNGHKENKPVDEADGLEDDDEEVELRPKINKKYLLTPEAKRVTIKASEIPDSTPKTPLLVTRHINSDGSVVTTPNFDQNI